MMNDDLNDLIAYVKDCYRLGITKPIQEERDGDRIANAKLLLAVARRLTLEQVLLVKQWDQTREQGFTLARHGKLDTAASIFEQLAVSLHTSRLPEEGLMVAETFLTASQSYVAYRAGDYHQARLLMFRALETNDWLIDRKAYDFLRPRRIHLVRNLMRVDASRGNKEDALMIGFSLLGYMEGDELSWPYPRHTIPSQRVARGVYRSMFNQVMSEIALILAQEPTPELFAYGSLHLHPSPHTAFRRAHQWLEVKAAFVEQNIEHFLTLAGEFIEPGRGDTPFLWHAVNYDVVQCLRAVDTDEAQSLAQEISDDCAAFPYLSPLLVPSQEIEHRAVR